MFHSHYHRIRMTYNLWLINCDFWKTMKRARRKQHQLFWKTHMLYPLFYLLIILHGIEGILQQPRFHFYLIVPGRLLKFNRDHRICKFVNVSFCILIRHCFRDRQANHATSCKERSPIIEFPYSTIWNYRDCYVSTCWIHLQIWSICQSSLLGIEQKRISSFYDHIVASRWLYFFAYQGYRKSVDRFLR